MSKEQKTTEPTGAASVSAHIQLFVDEAGRTPHLPSHTGEEKTQKEGILTGSEMDFLGQAIILCGNLN